MSSASEAVQPTGKASHWTRFTNFLVVVAIGAVLGWIFSVPFKWLGAALMWVPEVIYTEPLVLVIVSVAILVCWMSLWTLLYGHMLFVLLWLIGGVIYLFGAPAIVVEWSLSSFNHLLIALGSLVGGYAFFVYILPWLEPRIRPKKQTFIAYRSQSRRIRDVKEVVN
jgi:hypothetical protein